VAAQDLVKEVQSLGYQKSIDTYANNDFVELWQGSLRQLFIDQGSSNIIYQREVEIAPGVFTEIALLSEN
jgi:hypothetical protein